MEVEHLLELPARYLRLPAAWFTLAAAFG